MYIILIWNTYIWNIGFYFIFICYITDAFINECNWKYIINIQYIEYNLYIIVILHILIYNISIIYLI